MRHKRSIDHDRRKLLWLRPQIGHLRLVDVDRFIIAGIAERKLAESSPSTANRYLALIRAIVRKAAFDWEWIHKPPRVRLYKEPSRRVRWLTPVQVRTLLDELLPHQRDACLFALARGFACAKQKSKPARRASMSALGRKWIVTVAVALTDLAVPPLYEHFALRSAG